MVIVLQRPAAGHAHHAASRRWRQQGIDYRPVSTMADSPPQLLRGQEGSVTDAALTELIQAFRQAPTKHRAHEASQPVLLRLSSSPAFLREILERTVRSPDGLKALSYPVLAFKIDSNSYFDLVANAWIPHPDRDTDLSTKAIHHHGELLLTTVTLFGPGYEHWMFSKPELGPNDGGKYSMKLLERGRHELHNAVFVDAYTAHLPLFPPDLTITLCLWSDQRPKTWRDSLKRLPVLQRNSDSLRRLVTRLGLADQLAVKNVELFDFHPSAEGFVGMPEREEFQRGPNSEYLQNLFHVIQRTGNESLASVIDGALEGGAVDDPQAVRGLLDELRAGTTIEPKLAPEHYTQSHANFRTQDIERALSATSAS